MTYAKPVNTGPTIKKPEALGRLSRKSKTVDLNTASYILFFSLDQEKPRFGIWNSRSRLARVTEVTCTVPCPDLAGELPCFPTVDEHRFSQLSKIWFHSKTGGVFTPRKLMRRAVNEYNFHSYYVSRGPLRTPSSRTTLHACKRSSKLLEQHGSPPSQTEISPPIVLRRICPSSQEQATTLDTECPGFSNHRVSEALLPTRRHGAILRKRRNDRSSTRFF